MPMYWNPDLGVKKPLTMDDYEASFGDSMDIGFRTAYDLNPVQILKRNQAMSGWESGIDLLDATQELDPTLSLDEYQSQIARPVVPVEEQERQIKDAGLEGQLKAKEGYNQETINIIIENKQMENLAFLVRERAPGWHIIPDFASGFAASMLDPVNLATALIPVVGEQRLFSMLRSAKGAWGRAGVRAGVGAASGALGAVIMEPGIALGQMELQADYSFTQSLLNISMGAAMGGVLQPGFGALGELRRNRRGISHPWEFVEADEETRAMMKAHADEIYTHRMQSSANPNKLQFREEADYYAALFDARARTWAYKENRSVADYYVENKPAYRNWQDFDPDGWRDVLPPEWRNAGSQIGDELDDLSWIGRDYEGLKALNADAMTAPQFLEELGKWEERFPDMTDFGGIRAKIQDMQANGVVDAVQDKLFMALFKSKANDIIEYVKNIRNSNYTEKSFFHFRDVLTDGKQKPVEIGLTQVKHIDKRHPDFQDWEFIPNVIENGQKLVAGHDRYTNSPAYIYIMDRGDGLSHVVIAADVQGNPKRNRPTRHVVLTSFLSESESVRKWSFKYKNAASPSEKNQIPPSERGIRSSLPSKDSTMGPQSGDINKSLNVFDKEVNELLGSVNGKNGLFQSASQHVLGHKSRILAANSSEVGRYEVWELDDVIASHDPERQFARRDDYPEIAQERPYHSDLGEQEKVIENAIDYHPDYVISTDATAVNGPPIITSDGIVLGGNSRVMTLGMVYGKHPEKAAAYRQMLQDRAAMFGIDPNAVSGMKKPVLVRTVSGKLTPEEMAQRSREYNQSPGQSLQAQAEGVSRARFIGRQSMNLLATGLRDNESLAKFLDSDRSADFVNALLDEGVILRTEKSALTNPDGTLNNVGKDRVTGIMRGLVIPDYDLLSSLPKGALDKLDVALPAIALLRMRGEGWDLSGAIYEAMRFIGKSKAGNKSLERLFYQTTLGTPEPFQDNAVVQALAMTMAKGDAREVRLRMETFQELSNDRNVGQASLLGSANTITPEQAFRKAFLDDVAFIGKERLRNFDAANNDLDAAIQWSLNANKNTVEGAIAYLDKKLNAKKITDQEKELLSGHKKVLLPYSGAFGILEPKISSLWKDPGNLEIPAPKKPGEKGALPEATKGPDEIAESDLTNPDNLLPNELRDIPGPEIGNRGMVEFNTEIGRPIITLFQNADSSTIPHEFFHIFRHDLESSALEPDANNFSKEQWKLVCDFVGAKEGEAWTREMEEKFAEAGIRYMTEGNAPIKGLEGVFERIKQWLLDLYQKVVNAGVDISPEMRKVFNNMFDIPHDVADRNFRYALGDIHSRNPERLFADPAAAGKDLAPEDNAFLDAETRDELAHVEELTGESERVANETLDRVQSMEPEIYDRVMDEDARKRIEEANTEYKNVDVRDEGRRQFLECLMGGAQ